LAVDLRDKRVAFFHVSPALREPQSIHKEVERAIDAATNRTGRPYYSSLNALFLLDTFP
jgi:hypothetical protein